MEAWKHGSMEEWKHGKSMSVELQSTRAAESMTACNNTNTNTSALQQ